LSLFVSDYALYWYDYKAGYDTLLATVWLELQQTIECGAVPRAATAQKKDWGVIVTWEYTVPPYIESSEKLYEDLVLAYDNGAKYILVFDSDEDYTQSILQEEHLDTLKQFWEYAQDNLEKKNRSMTELP